MAAGGIGPAESPRLGSVFGHYRLDALVGRGGMGVVFRATDLRLERPVALKFLAPALAEDPAFRERFIRESRLAAAIEHHAIVPIYEAGAIDTSLYIAMRYVPGRDLGSMLKLEAPLASERTLALVRPLASALDAAHRGGLIHRDVKPANVLIEADGEERAFLADFGLTRRLGDLSAAGAVGTIDYAAPEVITGGPIDGRSDQYALACLVFHCLTGAPPFDLDSDVAVMYAHVNTPPPSIRAHHPELPARVDAALQRAMSKAPEERFVDCASFVAALEPEGEAKRAKKREAPGTPSFAPTAASRRPPWRRPALIGLGALTPIVVAVLLVVPGLPAGSADPDASPAPGSRSLSSAGDVDPLRVRTGEVIVFASSVQGDWDLYALEAGSERPRRLTDSPRDERSPAISPDGTTIAYVVGTDPERDIWLMDADGRHRRPLITGPADDIDPAWSSDGRSLAYASMAVAPNYEIYEIRDRGRGFSQRDARKLTERVALESYPTWRPGSRQLAVASNYFGNKREIVLIDADRSSSQRRITNRYAYDLDPQYSPDGTSIAFVRRPYDPGAYMTRGIPDILLIDPRSGRERRLTRSERIYDEDPDWAPDGRALAYATGRLGEMEIWAMTPDGERRRRLTRGWAEAADPAWGVLPSPAPGSSPQDGA